MQYSELILSEINDLVDISDKLSHDASKSSSGLGNDRIQVLSNIATRGGQLIRRLYGADSQYANSWSRVLDTEHFTLMHSNYYNHTSELVGILKGIQHDLQTGLLQNMRLLLQAEIFADFLSMAEYLLEEGYKDAAAVILGAVLEDSLRKLADKQGISLVSEHGKQLTIDPLNSQLSKKCVYNPLVQKQITTWATLRNDAAHGRFDMYDMDQVKQMLIFVQRFCADFLQ